MGTIWRACAALRKPDMLEDSVLDIVDLFRDVTLSLHAHATFA